MLNLNTSHSPQSLTASFLAEEYKRKQHLLARFSLITLLIVLVFSLQSLVYCVLAARWPVGYEAFTIVPFFGCLIAYRQAKVRFKLACWCVLGSCMAWVDYTLIQIGTGGNEIVGSSLLIVMAAVLMTSREVLLLTFCQAFALCGMYLIQNTLGLYQPPYTLGSVVEGTTGAVFALFGIPMLAALVLLPAKGQNRLLQNQNNCLSFLLLEVQTRQQISESVSGEVFSLSNQLKSASTIQAVGSQEQVSSITQVAAALTQLSASASSIATLTLQVSQTAKNVAEESQSLVQSSNLVVSQSEQGVQVVANTAQASEEVATQYHRLTQQLDELSKRNSISQSILELLRSIAAETHYSLSMRRLKRLGLNNSGSVLE